MNSVGPDQVGVCAGFCVDCCWGEKACDGVSSGEAAGREYGNSPICGIDSRMMSSGMRKRIFWVVGSVMAFVNRN